MPICEKCEIRLTKKAINHEHIDDIERDILEENKVFKNRNNFVDLALSRGVKKTEKCDFYDFCGEYVYVEY